MASGSRLSEPATKADVIGWALAVPLVLWLMLTASSAASLPGSFEAVLAPFDQPLPWGTRMVLALGGTGIVGVYALLAVAPIAVLLASRRSWAKVAAPIAFGALALCFNVYLIEALITPVAAVAQALR